MATSTPVTVSATTDCTVVSNLSVAGAVAMNLPAGVDGQMFFLLDGKQDAASNNITVTPNGAETINGAATLVMNHNGQGVWIQYKSSTSNWYVLANIVVPGTITPADIVGVIPANKGGTGIANNASSTLTISGAYATTLTVSGATGVTLPTTGTLATLAGSETLSNKTIASPTVTGELLLQNPSGSQPTLALSEDPDNGTNKVVLQAAASMASNYTLTMPNAQGLAGQTVVNDGAGALSWGSAGGTGALNLVENPNDASGWSETGSVFATPATTTTAGDLPLGGIVDTAIQFVASGSAAEATAYNSYSFTTPASMACKLGVYIYLRPGTGFVSNEWTVSVYAGSTRQNLSTDSSSVTYLPDMDGQFATSFDCLASTAYTIRFARTSGSGSATLNVANVQVTPGIQAQGAVVGDPQSWTPTFVGLGTPTITEAKWTRIGTKMFGYVRATSGTATADVMTMTLPNSLTAQITTSGIVGEGWRDNASASTRKRVVLRAAASSNLLTFSNDDYTWDVSPISSSQVGSNLIGNTTVFTLQFIVEIAEWQGSGTVNLAQNTPEFCYNSSTSTSANDTSSFAYGPAGALIQNITALLYRDVTLQYPIQVGDILEVQVSSDRTTWLSVGNRLPSSSGYPLSKFDYTYNGGAYKGIGILPQSSTVVRVYFGDYQASYSSTNVSWATGGGGALYWRVLHAPAGSAVGYGAADGTNSGLLPPVTSMGDALATQLGHKQYLHGGSYSGGGAPTVTYSSGGGSLSSVTRASFVPYKMQDGTWRMRFNIVVVASSTSRTDYAIAVNGVTFKNVSGDNQAISGGLVGVAGVAVNAAYVSANTGNMNVSHATSTGTGYVYSGDVELESKPTWAY